VNSKEGRWSGRSLFATQRLEQATTWRCAATIISRSRQILDCDSRIRTEQIRDFPTVLSGRGGRI
jgi:hypothetical protein